MNMYVLEQGGKFAAAGILFGSMYGAWHGADHWT